MTRVAFRFSVVYLALYCLATQVVGGLLLFPGFSFPGFGTYWPMRAITQWVARILGVTSPLITTGNSGDTAFYWVQTFWLLVVSAIVTLAWSDLDRQRADYPTLRKWFRLFIRFALAAQMFDYGMAKVIPTQFPAPSLVTLLEPIGHLSLTDVLWVSIGAATPYQLFTGCAEMLAGVLLIVPGTTLAGALICVADMTQVFVLNMAYDFGLKQISFHLILMALFLVAPDLSSLTNLFVLNRPAAPSNDPPLFATRRANRWALGAQLAFGLYLIAMFTRISASYWYGAGGGGSPKSPLYGIWEVQQLRIDGAVRPPNQNDYDRRWRRVIFDAPDALAFERTDESFAHYGAAIDSGKKTIALTKGNRASWHAHFAYERPSPDRLVLDGEMDSLTIHVELQRLDFDRFPLLNSGFRWIRPPDQTGG